MAQRDAELGADAGEIPGRIEAAVVAGEDLRHAVPDHGPLQHLLQAEPVLAAEALRPDDVAGRVIEDRDQVDLA